MARVFLIEATPWDAAGNVVNTYLAGGGSRPYTHRGRSSWKAGVVEEPKFSAAIGFDEAGWNGGVLPQSAKVQWFPADKATLTAVVARQWQKAPITVLVSDDAAPDPLAWTTLLTGTVAGVRVAGGALELTVADLGVKLADPFVTARFGGTGGVDGDASAEGAAKRRTLGKVFNVEGRVLNKAANVFEFGDPGFPLQAFTAIRDKGRAATAVSILAWQGSIAATYAALAAAAPPSGGAVLAPSIACVKWWTVPAGPLTADIQGEVGAGYVNTVVAIAQRIVTVVAALAWTAPTASVNAAPAGTEEAGIHIGDDSETIAAVLDRLLLGAGLVWILEVAGSVVVREFTFANPVETLTIVDTIERAEAYRPLISRKLAYQRSYRTHTDGEIAAVLASSDVTGLGGLAGVDYVQFGTPAIKSATGTTATDAAYQTGQGTALGIVNQAPAATDPTVESGATKNNPERALNRNSSFTYDFLAWNDRGGIYSGPASVAASANSTRGTKVMSLGPMGGRLSEYMACTPGETIYFAYRFATTANRADATFPIWYVQLVFAQDITGTGVTDGGPISGLPYSVAAGPQAGVAAVIVPAGYYAVAAQGFLEWQHPGSGATGYVDYLEIHRDQPGATVGADINLNVVDSGSANPTVSVPRNELRTPLGTALGILNQSAWATRVKATVSYGDSDVNGFGTLAPRSDVFFGDPMVKEASGGATATLANFKTPLGTALGIANQAVWATRAKTTISYGDGDVTGFGGLAPRNFAYFGSSFLTEDSGGSTQASLANFKTPLGTALGIANQSVWATRSKTTISYGDGDVTGFGGLAPRNFAYFGSSFLTEDSAGATAASLANFKTPLGTALGIANQAPAATDVTIQASADRWTKITAIGSNPPTIKGDSFTKTGGSAHDSGVVGPAFKGYGYVTVNVGATTYAHITFSANNTSTDYTLDIAHMGWDSSAPGWFFSTMGTGVTGTLSFTPTRMFGVYAGSEIRLYAMNDTNLALCYTLAVAAGLTLYPKGKAYTAGTYAGFSYTEPGANITESRPIVGKLDPTTGRVTDPLILNTQLLLGPRSATDVAPSYTVGGSNVTVSLPSHTRTVAGQTGKITITIGAASGVVAFSAYWAAYIDLATIASVSSPSVTFTSDPTDLLNSPNRLQLSSGIAPNAAGSGGTTTGGGGAGSLPRSGGGVYP